MDYAQILFPCGSLVVCTTGSGYTSYDIQKAKITEAASVELSFSFAISKSYITSNPRTFEPGCVFSLIDGSSYFFSFFDKNLSLVSELSLSVKSVLLNNFVKLYIEENVLYSKSPICETNLTLFDKIPSDSLFVCNDSHRALLISPSAPLTLIATEKKFYQLPPGFAVNMVAATFFDNETIAFSTNDKKAHLFSYKSGQITTFDVNRYIIKIDIADLDCFERSVVCLTDDRVLLILHFRSTTVKIISENVSDFTIVHSPFDRIIVLPKKGKIQFASLEDKVPLNQTVHSLIEALDSRIISGLAHNSDLRKRLTLRNQLSAPKETVQLPMMVTLFGKKEEIYTKIDDNLENDSEELQFWIENVRGTCFHLHCSILDFPIIYDIIISSKNMGFCCSYRTEHVDEATVNVICNFIIENIITFDTFSVFVRFEDKFYFAGNVEFAIKDLINGSSNNSPASFPINSPNGTSINRISEKYFISFPIKVGSLPALPFEHERADKGIIVHITADSCQIFQQKSMLILYSLPDSSVFQKRENSEKQVEIAKELAKTIEQFLQNIVMNTEQSVDRQKLLDAKTKIDDLLSSFLW